MLQAHCPLYKQLQQLLPDCAHSFLSWFSFFRNFVKYYKFYKNKNSKNTISASRDAQHDSKQNLLQQQCHDQTTPEQNRKGQWGRYFPTLHVMGPSCFIFSPCPQKIAAQFWYKGLSLSSCLFASVRPTLHSALFSVFFFSASACVMFCLSRYVFWEMDEEEPDHWYTIPVRRHACSQAFKEYILSVWLAGLKMYLVPWFA